jgi:16S rRNA (uracil1498-N3)-methyltransferase
MHRFFLPPEECKSELLKLTDREAHHALDVLRIREKESVSVLDGAGNEFICEAQAAGRREVELRVLEKKVYPARSFRITLLQALPKGKVIESIIQKATELGMFRLVPLLSQRVVSHLDDGDADRKVEKWKQVAIEAIKQCGSPWLPEIEAPVSPREFLERKERFDLSLIAALESERQHPRKYFQSFEAQQQRMPQSLCVWIGPEGDFTHDEVRAIKAGGALPITLGPQVLRTETAAIYCLSVLNYELQTSER